MPRIEGTEGTSESSQSLPQTLLTRSTILMSPLKEENALTLDLSPESKEEVQTPPKQPQYLQGWRFAGLIIALMLCTLMIALDTYIISTAVPAITTEFHSLNDIGWYGSAYFLTTMAFQPMFGKIYTHFNIKTVFAMAIVVFEVGSAISAAAVNSGMFIIGRLVSGIGGGGVFVGVITINGCSVPLEKVPFYISVITSTYGVASVAGPLLGGVFTDTKALTWRFCFWINLPLGFVSLILAILLCKTPDRPASTLSLLQKLASLDLGGTLLLVAAFVCLLFGLQWGGLTHAWNTAPVVGTIVGFFLITSVFLAFEFWQRERACLPLRVFRSRTISAGFVFTAAINVGVGVVVYWIPLYYQAVLGLSATQSGLRIIPFLTPMLFAPIISGAIVSRYGHYVPFMWAAGFTTTIGTGLLIVLSPTTRYAYIVGLLFLTGIGAGSGRQLGITAMQHMLPRSEVATASALYSFSYALGGTLATAISQAVFQNGLLNRLRALPGIIDPVAVVSGGALAIVANVPTDLTATVQNASSVSIGDTFVVAVVFSGVAFAASLCVKYASVKQRM